MLLPRGVKLEQKKERSLKREIEDLPQQSGSPVPKTFAPLKKSAGPGAILSACRSAGITDEFTGEPLERMLSRFAARKIQVLVVCCFDEDPFTSSAMAALREKPEETAAGLELAAKACGAKERLIAVGSRRQAHLLKKMCIGAGVIVAGQRYPAQLLLSRGAHLRGKRVGWVGVQACLALNDARHGVPQTQTVVTVAGDAVDTWGNFRVRIGTPVAELLKAGRQEGRLSVVAVRSSITGRSITDLSQPVQANTRCVIALKRPPARLAPFPCIGCGRCERVCPKGIIPWMVQEEMEKTKPDPFRLFHVQNCAACGACGAVCPAGIDLRAAVKRAAALKEGRKRP